jgi:hypothetical protein
MGLTRNVQASGVRNLRTRLSCVLMGALIAVMVVINSPLCLASFHVSFDPAMEKQEREAAERGDARAQTNIV